MTTGGDEGIMQNLHVVTRKEELDQERVAGKIVVVLDVLFATSTIVTALQHGARDVVPALDPDAARTAALGLPESDYVLAGERNLEPISGFAPYSPLRLSRHALAGKRLIYSTTNGTVALAHSRTAAQVYAAALLNGRTVADRLTRRHRQETVLLVCAGSAGRFNLEDFFGAGYLVSSLLEMDPQRWLCSDAAMAACDLYRAHAKDPAACLLRSRLGQRLDSMGLAEEVRYAAQTDTCPIVPMLDGDRLIPAPLG